MMQVFRNPSYRFIENRKWAYLFSAVVLVVCLGSLVGQGLRYDIDFTGGTLVQVRFDTAPSVADVRRGLARTGLGDAVIQEFGEAREFIIRVPLGAASSEEMGKRVEAALAQEPALGKVEVRRVEFVGPQVGRELQQQALYAVLAGLGGILLYIAIRFDIKGGVAAVAAVFHDVVVVLGALSLTHREFSLPVLAGVLTIIGYSVNDTIVIFDRVREKLRQSPRGPLRDALNAAINETLPRTLLTGGCTLIAALLLAFFAGEAIRSFGLVLSFGVAVGTLSSIFVASPVLLWLHGRTAARAS